MSESLTHAERKAGLKYSTLYHPSWDLDTIPDAYLIREYQRRRAAKRTEEQKRMGGRPLGAKDKEPRKKLYTREPDA